MKIDRQPQGSLENIYSVTMWVTWRLGLKFNNYQQMLGADKIRVKRSLFSAPGPLWQGTQYTFVYAVWKRMQGVMSKFTQPIVFMPYRMERELYHLPQRVAVRIK